MNIPLPISAAAPPSPPVSSLIKRFDAYPPVATTTSTNTSPPVVPPPSPTYHFGRPSVFGSLGTFGSSSSAPPPVVPTTEPSGFAKLRPILYKLDAFNATQPLNFNDLGSYLNSLDAFDPPLVSGPKPGDVLPVVAGSPLGSGKPHVETGNTALIRKSIFGIKPLSFRKTSSIFFRSAN